MIAKLENQINDITLNADGSMLFAADSSGFVHSWILKGLKTLPKFRADKSGLLKIKSFSLVDRRSSHVYDLLVTSGREQDAKFWCSPKNDSKDAVLVGQTPRFENPMSLMDVSEFRPSLWAVEKTGSLLGFRAEEILRFQSLRQCL